MATSRFSRSSALQCSCRTNDCSYLMVSYFRGSFKIKLFAIFKDSRTFDVVDVFSTSLCVLFFAKSQNFLSDSLSIILAINKSDFRCAVVRFCYYSYGYRPNWTPLSPITITYYAHKESSLTCVARTRFELLLYYER